MTHSTLILIPGFHSSSEVRVSSKYQLENPEPAEHELTNWKQLLTLGSMLLPPKEATSPSCRGIWMESCSSSPSRRWSQKPVELATCLNRSGGRRRTPEVKHCYQDVASSPDLHPFQSLQVRSTALEDMNTNTTPIWLLLFP